MRYRARLGVGSGGHGGINATPLIDVVMCLIVFYLIVGKLASKELSDVDLPDARAGEQEVAPERFVINIAIPDELFPAWRGGSATVIVAGEPVPSPDALSALLRDQLARKPETEVQVRASRRLTFGQVAPVLEVCSSVGVSRIRLATEDQRGG